MSRTPVFQVMFNWVAAVFGGEERKTQPAVDIVGENVSGGNVSGGLARAAAACLQQPPFPGDGWCGRPPSSPRTTCCGRRRRRARRHRCAMGARRPSGHLLLVPARCWLAARQLAARSMPPRLTNRATLLRAADASSMEAVLPAKPSRDTLLGKLDEINSDWQRVHGTPLWQLADEQPDRSQYAFGVVLVGVSHSKRVDVKYLDTSGALTTFLRSRRPKKNALPLSLKRGPSETRYARDQPAAGRSRTDGGADGGGGASSSGGGGGAGAAGGSGGAPAEGNLEPRVVLGMAQLDVSADGGGGGGGGGGDGMEVGGSGGDGGAGAAAGKPTEKAKSSRPMPKVGDYIFIGSKLNGLVHQVVEPRGACGHGEAYTQLQRKKPDGTRPEPQRYKLGGSANGLTKWRPANDSDFSPSASDSDDEADVPAAAAHDVRMGEASPPVTQPSRASAGGSMGGKGGGGEGEGVADGATGDVRMDEASPPGANGPPDTRQCLLTPISSIVTR